MSCHIKLNEVSEAEAELCATVIVAAAGDSEVTIKHYAWWQHRLTECKYTIRGSVSRGALARLKQLARENPDQLLQLLERANQQLIGSGYTGYEDSQSGATVYVNHFQVWSVLANLREDARRDSAAHIILEEEPCTSQGKDVSSGDFSGSGSGDLPSSSGDGSGDLPSSSGSGSGDLPSSSGGGSGDLPSSSGGSSGNLPSSSGGGSGDLPSSSGGGSGDLPSSSGGSSGDLPSSSGGSSGDLPSSSGGGSGDLPSSSGGSSGDLPSSSGGGSGDLPSSSDGGSGDLPSSSGGGSGDLLASSGDLPASSGDAGDLPASSGDAGDLPASSGDAGDLPASSGDAGDLPASSGDAGDLPASSGDTGDLPTSGGDAGDLPTSSGDAGDLPTSSGDAGDLPTSSGDAGDLPASSGDAGDLPASSGDAGDLPASSGDAGDLPCSGGGSSSLPSSGDDSSDQESSSPPVAFQSLAFTGICAYKYLCGTYLPGLKRNDQDSSNQVRLTRNVRKLAGGLTYKRKALQQLEVEDLSLVHYELYDARSKWYDLGMKLGLKVDVLARINCCMSWLVMRRFSMRSSSDCLREVLQHWLQSSPCPTWEDVCAALRSYSVREYQLAQQLEETYGPVAKCRAAGRAFKLQPEDLSTVHEELYIVQSRDKWHDLGVQLGVPSRAEDREVWFESCVNWLLTGVVQKYSDLSNSLLDYVLLEWLEPNTRTKLCQEAYWRSCDNRRGTTCMHAKHWKKEAARNIVASSAVASSA